MVKIKLVDNQIDRIIIDELKNDYRINLGPNQIDCSDDTIAGNQSLLDAIKCVLRYYMTSVEYERWEINSSEPEEHDGPFTIEVTWDQLRLPIVEDLKIVYESNHKPESCGIYGMSQLDTELVSSVDQLLQYYMSEPDYKQWKESLND